MIEDGFLFHGTHLCILERSLRDSLIHELHGGVLGGHFGQTKTISLVEQRYFWPKLRRDVIHYVSRCRICQSFKGHSHNTGLYTPFP